ncbi:MAG: VanZ family protein [Prevotella sp.]|nr:VanZ family protein [Prevotella sp.]
MSKIVHFVSRYPLSILCVVLIWILSLMPFFPETPFDQVEFIDKWTHLVMYGGTCSVIWWEYLRNHQILDGEKLFFYAWLCPALMSGLLELLQEYCTFGHRNGDWLDFAANTMGVTLGALIGLLMYQLWFKRKR